MSMSTLVPLRPSWLPMTLVPEKRLTDAEFEELCFSNDLIQFERTRDGEIVMNPPTAMGTSDGNAEITAQLRVWWKTHRRGRVFDSNGGFFLPDGFHALPGCSLCSVRYDEGHQPGRLEAFAPPGSRFCDRTGFYFGSKSEDRSQDAGLDCEWR